MADRQFANPLTPARRRVLLTAVELTARLGRPPNGHEVAIEIGGYRRVHLQVAQLRRAGYVTDTGRPLKQRQPHYVRLTPRARLELGLPLLVYVAWALPRLDDTDEAHEAARAAGAELARWIIQAIPTAAPASPLLVPHRAAQVPALLAAAGQLAAAADAVIVHRDPFLIGRADVMRANETAAPVVLTDAATCEEISAGADPWDLRWRIGKTAIAFRAPCA